VGDSHRRSLGRRLNANAVFAARLYDEESRKLVAEKYRDDIETFGYQFDDGS